MPASAGFSFGLLALLAGFGGMTEKHNIINFLFVIFKRQYSFVSEPFNFGSFFFVCSAVPVIRRGGCAKG